MEEQIMEEQMKQLRVAAAAGNVNEVRRLVRTEGVNPESVPRNGNRTPLHCACAKGNFAVVEYLVGEVGVDTNRTEKQQRWTALHFACFDRFPRRSQCLPVVRYLVESGGANVEAATDCGNTPLHLASHWGRADIVRYLVEHQQANVDAKNYAGLTPLDHAVDGPIIRHLNHVVTRYLFPRTKSVAVRTLKRVWEHDRLVEFRGMMLLEKYAFGAGLANVFRRNPIHTLLLYFPLPSTMAFQDAIKLFPSSVLSILDEEYRLSIHVALITSQELLLKSPLIIGLLFDREPRSALARDPSTGLYPHETVSGFVSNDEKHDDDVSWFDIVYKMFRSNPNHFLQSRVFIANDMSSSSRPSKRFKTGASIIRIPTTNDTP